MFFIIFPSGSACVAFASRRSIPALDAFALCDNIGLKGIIVGEGEYTKEIL
jgi:hypothetical protein